MKNILIFSRFYRKSSLFNVEIPKNLNEILIGLMLGDLTAERPSLNHNTRLQFKQSIINEKYIDHLYDLFKDFTGSKPIYLSRFDQRENKMKTYYSVKFQTLSLPCFNIYRELFYDKDKIKRIPKNISDLLTEKGLAYWIMDDGYKSQKGIYI